MNSDNKKNRIEMLNKTKEDYRNKIEKIELQIQIEKTNLKKEKLKHIKSPKNYFNK